MSTSHILIVYAPWREILSGHTTRPRALMERPILVPMRWACAVSSIPGHRTRPLIAPTAYICTIDPTQIPTSLTPAASTAVRRLAPI